MLCFVSFCLVCCKETLSKYSKVLRDGEIVMYLKDFHFRRAHNLQQVLSDKDTTTTIDLDAVP